MSVFAGVERLTKKPVKEAKTTAPEAKEAAVPEETAKEVAPVQPKKRKGK